MSNSRYADTDRMKNVFLSDFRNRTWIEPKPDDERIPAYWKALPLPLGPIKKDTYMCSFNFIGNIVFTLNHVHYNLSIVHC